MDDSTHRDVDDDGFSLVTVTSISLQESTGSTFVGSAYTNCKDKFACRVLQRQGRIFNYRRRKIYVGDGIFSAPTGVCPHRVTSSIIRRNTGSSFHERYNIKSRVNKKPKLLSYKYLFFSRYLFFFLVNEQHCENSTFLNILHTIVL